MAEVIGGGTLQRAIEEGDVPMPELLGYQSWISWRASAGLRPTVRKTGHGTSSAQEAELWRATMSRIYGEGWRTLLEDEELKRAEAAEEEAIRERERRMRESIRRRLAAEATMGALDLDDELLKDVVENDQEASRVRRPERSEAGSSDAPPSPRTLRRLIKKPIDLATETLASYQEKIKRLSTKELFLHQAPKLLQKIPEKMLKCLKII